MASSSDIRAGRAYVELSVHDKLTRGLRSAQRKLSRFGDQITRVGLTVGVGVAAGLKYVTNAAGDAVETANRFRQVFKGSADQAGTFVEKLAQRVGRASTDIQQSLSTFQGFFVGLNFDSDKAAELSEKVQKLSLDFASFNNISDEEAGSRFLAALSGSSEVLDQFGVNIKAAALNTELLNRGFTGGVQGATEQQKAIARLAIIMRAMTDQGAVGDAVRTAGSYVNQLKAMRAGILKARIAVGTAFLPAVTALAGKVKDLANATSEWAKANKAAVATLGDLSLGVVGVAAGAVGLGLAAKGVAVAIGGLRSIGTVVTKVGELGAAITFIAGSPVAVAILGLTALTSVIVGLIAVFNDGKVAGIDFGGAILKVTNAIGLTDFRTATAHVRELNGELVKLGKQINQLGDRANDKKLPIASRVKAQVDKIEAQTKRLRRFEKEAARQENPRRVIHHAGGGHLVGPAYDEVIPATHANPALIANIDKQAERIDAARRKLVALRLELAKVTQQKLATGLAQAVAKVNSGFAATLGYVKALGRELNKRHRETVQLIQSLKQFTGTPIQGQVIQVIQRRDGLERKLSDKGLLTPKRRRQIEAAADRKILEIRTQGARRLQSQIERLQIETTKKGLAKRLALLELERKLALALLRREGRGGDANLLNQLFDLKENAARQADKATRRQNEKVTGTFNATALNRLFNSPQKELLDVSKKQYRELREIVRNTAQAGLAFS